MSAVEDRTKRTDCSNLFSAITSVHGTLQLAGLTDSAKNTRHNIYRN